MKARVKASGLMINAVPFNITYENGRCIRGYIDSKTDIQYAENEIDFINIEIQDEPDYWEKLKHQYAGMAMQGILSNPVIELDFEGTEACVQATAQVSLKLATALVNKLKEEEKQPAYDCKYIGLGENCHLHSGLTEHGHTQMGCVGKCKDYRKKREYEQNKEAPSDGRKKS